MWGSPVRYKRGKGDPSVLAPSSGGEAESPCGVDGLSEDENASRLPSPVRLHRRLLSPGPSLQPQTSHRARENDCGILRSAVRLQYRTYVVLGLLFALFDFAYLASVDLGPTANGGLVGPGWPPFYSSVSPPPRREDNDDDDNDDDDDDDVGWKPSGGVHNLPSGENSPIVDAVFKQNKGHEDAAVRMKDFVRSRWLWDASPIVIESHKLIFFSVPKVACTVFKQLFRRMMGHGDWNKSFYTVHDPRRNGLAYLRHYPKEDAVAMLTSPEWTNAIFIREPKERLLSAFLDKAKKKNGVYVKRHCQVQRVPENLSDFLDLTNRCYDPHWAPQTERLAKSYCWDLMDFVGSFDNAYNHTKALLKRIGAWDEFGSSGWGASGDEEIFGATKTHHATGSSSRLEEYYTDSLKRKVEARYAVDYENARIAKALKLDEAN